MLIKRELQAVIFYFICSGENLISKNFKKKEDGFNVKKNDDS